MFGYIRTDTPELRVRENEYYRAVYCGLCRAQGKCTGQCSRFSLSYDMVFLSLLRLAVSEETPTIRRGRCIAHPFKKRAYLTFSEPLSYCAYAAALLIHGKVADDLQDEKGFRRLKAKLMRPLAKRMRKKTPAEYRILDERITELLQELSVLEKQKIPSVDAPADLFGELLGEICAFGLDETNARILRNVGRHVGRWIYIVDAVDDLEEDVKKGRFNPFVCLYGESPLTDAERHGISDALRLELSAAEPAIDLLDFTEKRDIEEIVKNILYLGMPEVADRILGLACDEKTVKKRKNRKDDLQYG